MRMKKRLLSMLLVFSLAVSLLPTTALAAVGDLLDNTPAENQSLLEQLENFTGDSYEEAYQLLSSLGLLDEDGSLITDMTIDLDGVEYTLEEIEALLSDPDTDLTEVAEVDGVPIALGDLKTIIAIERELQYLQETYFSGRTFEGEALVNLNSLMAQLQSEGLTLSADTRSAEDQIVFDTSKVQETASDNRPIYYISAGNVTIPQGTTLTVKFKLNLSDAMENMEISTFPMVYLSDTVGKSTLTHDYLAKDGRNSEIIYIQNGATTAEEYTLSVKANYPYEGPLYLCLWGPSKGTYFDYKTNFAEYSYGTLWQAVSFYDADGFFFQNGSGGALRDQWTGYFSVENSLPAMGNSCSVTGNQLSFSGGRNFLEFSLVDSTATIVENTLTYLQRCIDKLNTDNAVRFQLNATLAQTNNESHPLIIPKDVFIHVNSGRDDLEYHGYYIIEENSLTGNFPITLASGSGTTTISFTGLTDKFNSSDGKSCILPRRFSTVMCNSTSVTPAQIDDISNISQYTYSIDNFTSTTNCTINLVNDNIKPTLAVSAPAGSYQSGDVIPITITGNEFIKVSDLNSAQITINNTPYSLSDLHASSSGKYISLFYEVKEIDNATLTVGVASNSGITDYWGNQANAVNNVTVSGVSITSPLLKNAVTGLTANYNEDAGKLSFGITVNQDSRYQQLYSAYRNNPTGAMQLLISVDGAAAVTHPVTMSGSGNTYTFTAADYEVPQTATDQAVTVQLQVNNGSGGWTTLGRLTTSVTIAKRVDVTGVAISVVNAPENYNYTIALSDENIPKLEARVTPSDATYKTGTWSSNNLEVADITQDGQIQLKSVTGTVSFRYTADNGTPDDPDDDKYADSKEFTITAGNQLYLGIPKYAQESLIQADKPATVTWNTNVFAFYPEADVTFTVSLYAGTDTTGTPSSTYTVENPADSAAKVTSCTIPADDLEVTYPQSQYTVRVSMESPEPREDTASITVLSPPTVMRITADTTSITDGETLDLTCTISNGATGALSVKRMADGATEAVDVTNSCLSGTSVTGGSGKVTFTPKEVSGTGLYDTYTITFTEDTASSAGASFTPSSDSIVLTVYRSGALDILVDGKSEGTITLSNTSKVDGDKLPTTSQAIMALRQELGLIEYVSINANAYNWSSFSDGIEWVSDHPDAVGVYYRQGGLWDNIEDLTYKTYLPQSQMAVSATADAENVTITAIHAATGMKDSVTVNVETLENQLYLFQVSPAVITTLTYTNGDGVERKVTTNDEGVLALYEPSGIASDVYLRSGDDDNPNLGTIRNSALSSGERDAAKLQLYPLNTITLRPAAQAELYLVKPDGTPYVGSVTLRGGVYLAGTYCEGVQMGKDKNSFVYGNQDGTYTTDADGKLTVYMDATQFVPDGYTGQLTNAELDYWFELRGMGNDAYYPTLVNIQGSMSPDYSLRTGSAVVTLREVPSGEAEAPFVIAQTLSYAQDSEDDLQVRNVLGSTGKVGPNSTYKYTELTTRVMLWGVDNGAGASTISMTWDNGYAPAAQTVDVNTFPFASIPIITNTLVLTKETMTDSGWLKAETPANLRVSVYQNDRLLRSVSMPFQVVDLTNVKLVDEDAEALVLEMKGNLVAGFGTTDGTFNFGSNTVGNAFTGKITGLLNDIQENVNPLFRVLITPSEDSSVFNVLVWGGYDSLDIDDFDYSSTGFAMDHSLMQPELDVGVPPLNDLSDMAKGTYDAVGTINETKYNRTNSGLDIGAQLEGYYEGQFYYDTDQHKWAFHTLGGGMSAGASLSFQANVNAWAGPVPITATFAAGIALQLEFKAATVYKDQQTDAALEAWTPDALEADSVNDYLTTLRIQGYIDAFGGLGFDYSIIALKIGLFGRLTADSTNTFLSRTYLKDKGQINGQALGITGEVGIKFYAKLLFVSYEAVIGSGKIGYSNTFHDYTYINNYWSGSSATGASLASMGAPTLLSRSYLTAYANGVRTWTTPTFSSTAAVVQSDANPGSEPAVNDDGSLSVYISDQNNTNYFASRIVAGAVGTEGTVIDDNGFGDMSPSLSGSGNFSVAAWVRLFEELQKDQTIPLSPDEEKQLLNSTEIMVATTNGAGWTTTRLTNNASPDLAPVTAASDSSAIVFWRGVYTTDDNFFASDTTKPSFDTQDVIYFKQYSNSNGTWGEAQMVYNGSLGSVVGLKAAMLSNGTAIVVFTVDRTGSNDASGYEIAYRTVDASGTLGDLVVLTSDSEIDTNPQVVAITNGSESYFVLGWYTSQDGGDIRLQAVGQSGQLYSGSSANAVPASVKAITGEDDLGISADFQFAKGVGQTLDGLTLVWAETAANASGKADHSVLYGTQLCRIDGKLYLSNPQALITLPERTLANSFSAWKDNSSGQINAYIFGTWYDPVNKETISGIEVPLDTDKLLTGGGAMQTNAVSVDPIAVDYPNLQTDSWTPVVFTIRNTGTTALTNVKASVGSYNSNAVTLYPGESAKVTVTYKTDSTITSATNPTYTISADGAASLVSGTLHLDYNDIGISSMKVVSEGEGKRTVQVTLYNDTAAKLEGSGRTVELSFYTDSEHSDKANDVTLLNNSQSGVTASGSTVTLSGDALKRIDQGSMTILVEYDLASYVTGTLDQDEVPASGVYLYASAAVKESGKTMAEYATGNNDDAVQLTGAYARTGKKTTLNVTQTNGQVTTAVVELTNNSLQDQTTATLVASLLDADGRVLDTETLDAISSPDDTLPGETAKTANVTFDQLGSRVVVYAAASGEDSLSFDGLPVTIDDFTLDGENGNSYTYTLPDVSAESTLVTAISGDGKTVTIDGQEFTGGGSLSVPIGAGETTITVTIDDKTYTLHIDNPPAGGTSTPSYRVTVEDSANGTVTASPTYAARGRTVTLTVEPDSGYRLAALTVTDRNGREIEWTDQGGGRYTFSMPSSAVTVEAVFAAVSPGGLPFTDVPEDAWYRDAVAYVYTHGLMAGTTPTTFAPEVTTSRAMIVTILWRLAGSPVVDYAMDYTDVDPGAWYGEAVRWATSEGVVGGYGGGRFGPNDPITREQFAAMLWRYAGNEGYDVSVGENTDLLSYTDAQTVSEYAIPAMQWAVGTGIIGGTTPSTLTPYGGATRAQAAMMLMRFCKSFESA